jgi:arabinogalactan endo-1,4-beta-galactosidase
MPNINEAFPSNYIKAADLKGRQVSVKMDRAEYEMIGQDKKLILYFVGKEKGMVLNKTNASNIAAVYGDDTDEWRDQEIILFEAMVDFQGKTVPAIRVKGPVKAKPAARQASADMGREAAPAKAPAREVVDDEIPF